MKKYLIAFALTAFMASSSNAATIPTSVTNFADAQSAVSAVDSAIGSSGTGKVLDDRLHAAFWVLQAENDNNDALDFQVFNNILAACNTYIATGKAP